MITKDYFYVTYVWSGNTPSYTNYSFIAEGVLWNNTGESLTTDMVRNKLRKLNRHISSASVLTFKPISVDEYRDMLQRFRQPESL